MENSKIEWCKHTMNFWIGCTEVGPACDFCYARVMMQDRYHRATWGPGQARIRTSKENWRKPYQWNRAAALAGERHAVFSLSLADIWDNEVDPAWRRDAFRVMRDTKNLIYLLLSKRIGNAVEMAEEAGGLPPNAAIGATMANQAEWDRDAPKLEAAAKRLNALFTFASVEPMLGRIWIGDWCPDQVICGGESGPNARIMDEMWAYELMQQVRVAKKAFFMKQMTGKKPIPDDLFVRQFPAQMTGIGATT